MNEVDQQVHLRPSRIALIVDHIQLVAGPVGQHHPLPLAAGVAPLGLVEHRRDHLVGVPFDRGSQ
ncbi:hypothetical protein O1L44_19670 [Streptomyces noursei]|uniref:hypothetical protein n=1 Tax=Streptomyces noursei TaxID=1971 RepID=UPI00082B4A9D|nr:hypothetical protein [Streptomyces noursei]